MTAFLRSLTTKYNIANAIGLLALFLSAISQLLIAAVIKNNLGAEALGLWHLIYQTFRYLHLPELGATNGIIREIALHKNDRIKLDNIYYISRKILSFIGLAVFFLGAISIIIIPYFIDIHSDYKFIFITSILGFTIWGVIKFQFLLPFLSLMGQNRIVEYNILELLQGAGRPLLGSLFIYLKPGILGIVAAYIAIEAVVLALASNLMKIAKKVSSFNYETPKKIFSFGIGTSIVGISNMITLYSSSFIIVWSLGIEQVAVYQSTISLPLLALRICVIPFSNLLPKYISLYKTGGHNAFYIKSLTNHLFVALALIVILSIVYLLNKGFVALWLGERLFAGQHFSFICCTYVFISVLRHNGYIINQALGNIRMLCYGHLLEIFTTIGLSLVLVKNFGLIGMIYAAVIGHLVPLAISQIHFIKRYDTHSI